MTVTSPWQNWFIVPVKGTTSKIFPVNSVDNINSSYTVVILPGNVWTRAYKNNTWQINACNISLWAFTFFITLVCWFLQFIDEEKQIQYLCYRGFSWDCYGKQVLENFGTPRKNTAKRDFIALLQVNEISLTIIKFHYPLIFLLTINNFINGKK